MKRRVRFLIQIAGRDGTYNIGQVAEIGEKQANEMIKYGYAELVRTSPIETAIMPEPETTVARKKKK